MKKIIYCACTAFLLSFTGQSQNFSIQKGPEFIPGTGRFDSYIGQDSTGLYAIRTLQRFSTVDLCIQKIDLGTLLQVYMTTPLNGSNHSIFLVGNRIMAFTEVYNKKERMKYLILKEFNAKTGKENGADKQILAIETEPAAAELRQFYVSLSADKSKMLVVDEFKPAGKLSEVVMRTFETETGKLLSTKKAVNAYQNSTVSSSNYRVDNNGAVYYLFNYMIDFEEQIGGLALASIRPDETKSIVTPLPFEKLDIMNGTFTFANNDLVFCGLYKDIVTRRERREGKVQDVGVYTFFIDGKTGEVKNKGFDYFSPEVKAKLTYADGLIKKSPADKFYSFEKIITFNNNTYLIESHSYMITSNGGSSNYERELIVSKFNSQGKMEWMKLIPKFTANGLNEFNYVVRNNKVYLFYAEHPKNVDRTSVDDYNPRSYRPIRNYNGSLMVCTSFDESGMLSRKEVFRNEGWCYDPNSTNILMDGDNGLLLRMINKEMERYDKISIFE